MKKTMFEIEGEARWRVWALFGLLLLMVDLCVWVVVLLVNVFINAMASAEVAQTDRPIFALSPAGVGLILLGSAAFAGLYWFVSRSGARDRLIRVMHARPLDPADRFHQRLADIVEEMRIATGAPAIRCLTVPTLGMNAFAFSDLRGGACIGVTEGALSRLSRPQLEAVVAHEFGHVLSGDYVTVTSACLLFGVFTSLGDGLQEAGEDSQAVAPLLAAGLAGLVVWLLQLGAAVISAAISRQREWAADLAAARYTRDPLSLAQALQMMVSHPGGSGYIPDGLAALCMTPTDVDRTTAISRAMATHPPVSDRILALLKIAHVDAQQFQEQVAAAEAVSAQREHVATTPAAATATAAAERLTQLVAGPLLVAMPAAAAPLAASPLAPPPAAAPLPAALLQAAVAPGAAPAASAPLAAAVVGAAPSCPGCGAGLERADYEGTGVLVCRSCGGRLATTPQVQRILTRREMRFDERQQQLADAVMEHGDELRRDFARTRASRPTALVACPRCGRSMMRRHFSYDEAVEIDYCSLCDLYWFEKDELEVLQVIVERETQ